MIAKNDVNVINTGSQRRKRRRKRGTWLRHWRMKGVV